MTVSAPPVPPVPPAPPPAPRAAPRLRAVLLPHLVWEGVLLLLLVAVIVVATLRAPLFAGPGPWWSVAVYGLLASGLALSLRTGTPNLAVGGVALATAALYAWLVTDGELPAVLAAAVALLVALVVGAVLGALVGLTSAPAWAVSLGGLALAYAATVTVLGSFQPRRAEPLLTASGWWVALFLLVSLGGGVAWMALPGLRRWLGAEPAGGGATGAGPAGFRLDRLVGALVGFAGSSLLAGLSGLAMASQLQSVSPNVSIFSLLVALAAVLVGGVSAAGGRGGVAGTVLGTILVAVIFHWLVLSDLRSASATLELDQLVRFAVLGMLILVGVLVGRGLTAVTAVLSPPGPVPPPGPPPVPPAAAVPVAAAPPASAPGEHG